MTPFQTGIFAALGLAAITVAYVILSAPEGEEAWQDSFKNITAAQWVRTVGTIGVAGSAMTVRFTIGGASRNNCESPKV